MVLELSYLSLLTVVVIDGCGSGWLTVVVIDSGSVNGAGSSG